MNRFASNLSVYLGSHYLSSLRPEEVALFAGLDGRYPSFGHIILRFDLTKSKNLIVSPRLPLEMFRFNKLLVVSSYFT